VNPTELKATTVLHMKIEEGAAKVRTGPPVDDQEDYGLPVWAGVVPVRMQLERPVPDDRLDTAVGMPAYLADLAHIGLTKS